MCPWVSILLCAGVNKMDIVYHFNSRTFSKSHKGKVFNNTVGHYNIVWIIDEAKWFL